MLEGATHVGASIVGAATRVGATGQESWGLSHLIVGGGGLVEPAFHYYSIHDAAGVCLNKLSYSSCHLSVVCLSLRG